MLCVAFQDAGRAERVVLAGAAVVSKGSGLGGLGGPGWTCLCQSQRLMGGTSHRPGIPHCPPDL